jgi:hypothetical protein
MYESLKHSKHVSLALGVLLETFEEVFSVFSVVSAHSENASSRNMKSVPGLKRQHNLVKWL